MREDWRENRSGEGEERRIEIYICLFIHGEFPLPYRCASKRLLSRLVDDETGAGITSSARRNLKLTPGNREQREPTKMLSAGSVCKHRENATRKSALKKEKVSPPSTVSGGWGVSFLLLARDEIERKRRSSRDIDTVCTGFLLLVWIFNLE